MKPEDVVELFVEAVNSRNIDGLSEMMTDDHVYIDSDGTEYPGRRKMLKRWVDYFTIVPDYRIEVREKFVRDDTVVLLGIAEGTFARDGALFPENHWSVPAAWRAVVDNERVSVWQLYVNPEPMRIILIRMEATGPFAGPDIG